MVRNVDKCVDPDGWSASHVRAVVSVASADKTLSLCCLQEVDFTFDASCLTCTWKWAVAAGGERVAKCSQV